MRAATKVACPSIHRLAAGRARGCVVHAAAAGVGLGASAQYFLDKLSEDGRVRRSWKKSAVMTGTLQHWFSFRRTIAWIWIRDHGVDAAASDDCSLVLRCIVLYVCCCSYLPSICSTRNTALGRCESLVATRRLTCTTVWGTSSTRSPPTCGITHDVSPLFLFGCTHWVRCASCGTSACIQTSYLSTPTGTRSA